MKIRMDYRVAKLVGRALLLVACGAFAAGAAYSQNGGDSGSNGTCTATQLRLRIATGGDDLRGGQDNLNIVVYFTTGSYQIAPNVNHNQNWPNNSVNIVDIPLNRPVLPNEIRALRLVHIADGGFNIRNIPELATPAAPIAIAQAFQSPDNWNMADLEVAAIGNGVGAPGRGARIANYGFHRFTGSNPDLIVGTHVPPDICGSGGPNGSSGGTGSVSSVGSAGNAGGKSQVSGGGNSSGGSGMLLSPGAQKTMLRTQANAPGGNGGKSALIPAVQRPPINGNLGDGNRAAGTSASSVGDGGKKADDLSPQPYPPKGKGNASMDGNRLRGGNPRIDPKALAHPRLRFQAKSGPRITNTSAAQAHAAMMALLGKQRSAADAEVTRIGLAFRAQGQGALGGQSQTMSATPQTQPPQTGAANAGKTSPANRAAAPQVRTIQRAPAGTLSPAQTSSSTISSIGRLSNIDLTALSCTNNPTMRIMNVSGSYHPATFTPIEQPVDYNFYTITGCSFGNNGPNAKVYIYTGSTFREDFNVQEWHDTWIKLNLDANLTGLLDQDNLTLVVQRDDGQQTSKGGFKFYAARESKRLAAFPQQYFSLYKFTLNDVSDLRVGFSSPVNPAGNFPNNTVEVTWWDPDLQAVQNNKFVTAQNTPPSGTDIYDFSHLAAGFEVTSASINSPDPNSYCSGSGMSLVAASGNFGGQFNGAQIWITWQGWNCNWNKQNCDIWGCTDIFEYPITDYGLDVLVEGPRGVDPWTGLPTKP